MTTSHKRSVRISVPVGTPGKSTDIVGLLARCVLRENTAWKKLQKDYHGFVQAVFCTLDCSGRPRRIVREQAEEFSAWFFSWLAAYGHRLQNALTHLDAEIKAGRASTVQAQERCFKNYLAHVLKSAWSEFHREIAGTPPGVDIISGDTKDESSTDNTDSEQVPLFDRIHEYNPNHAQELFGNGLATIAARRDLIRLVKRALASMNPALAVPLVLKSRPLYEIAGLPPSHIKWIALQSGTSPNAVAHLIEQEFLANHGCKYPFKAAFVANLLGLSAPTVDQRAHRALPRLRQALLTLAPDLLA